MNISSNNSNPKIKKNDGRGLDGTELNTKNPTGQMAETAMVVLGIRQKKITIRRKDMKKIVADGLKEIAFSCGHTNNPDEFIDTLTHDIMLAFQEVHERQSKKKKSAN